MSILTLNASARSVSGRKVKRLRPQGIIPVVIYGRERVPQNAQVDGIEFERVLREGGNSQLVRVDLEGEEHNILVREVQRHPVRHNLLHADFYAISMSDTQQLSVPLIIVGDTSMGSGSDLVMVQAMDSVEIEALPIDIPAQIEIDISRLESQESPSITVADLPSIPGVTYISDPDEAICSLILSRAAVSEEDEEAEEELVDIDAEPEVIGRGREEEEE